MGGGESSFAGTRRTGPRRFTGLLDFLSQFESVVPEAAFQTVKQDCRIITTSIFDDVALLENLLRQQFVELLTKFASEALKEDKMKRVVILVECLNGATRVLCKEHPEHKGVVDGDAGFAGLTDFYIPFGHKEYSDKAFLVGEGKNVIEDTPGQPWYGYSEALAAQIFGSMMGHDAPVGMIYLFAGVKFFYRVPVNATPNAPTIFELRQYPPGPDLLEYSETDVITDIFLHIARIGMRDVHLGGSEKRKAVMVALKKRRTEEARCLALGNIAKKTRAGSADTANFADNDILFKSRTGEVVTFTSLDLVSRLGEEGIRDLQEELLRRKGEEQEECLAE